MKTLLNTTIKEEWRIAGADHQFPEYCLRHLENEASLTVLIQEVEKTLFPCAHCGAKGRIEYGYLPKYYPYMRNPSGKSPHELYVLCDGHRGVESEDRCGMEGRRIYAEDNEADFREALRLIVKAWNRRPCV